MDKDYLTLKRANASRPSGQWRHDDYDVICDGAVVGRIMHTPAARRRGHGGGRTATAIIEIAPPLLATRRRARLRWLRSQRAGGGRPDAQTMQPLAKQSCDRDYDTRKEAADAA
jgi:hypothetical protein